MASLRAAATSLLVPSAQYTRASGLVQLAGSIGSVVAPTIAAAVVVAGWLVTTLHGYLNAVFIAHLGEHFTPDWFSDPRFLIGMAIYLTGFILNLQSDAILRNLRSKEEVERGERMLVGDQPAGLRPDRWQGGGRTVSGRRATRIGVARSHIVR